MTQTETFETCASCGATIYPEHIASHKAERIGGKLLCVHCVRETKSGDRPTNGEGSSGGVVALEGDAPADAAAHPDATPASTAPPPTPMKHQITFDRQVGARKSAFKRPLLPDLAQGTRCRVWHCRLNEAAVRIMEEQMNEWIDSDEAIRIKFSSSSVGAFDGKTLEPHLIVTVFY